MTILESVGYAVYIVWLFSPILALAAWFVISLVQFLKTPKEEYEKRMKKRTMLVVSGVLFGGVAFIYLLFLAAGITSSM